MAVGVDMADRVLRVGRAGQVVGMAGQAAGMAGHVVGMVGQLVVDECRVAAGAW